MQRTDTAQSRRVVNEDPTESYVSIDDEFWKETVDPLVVLPQQQTRNNQSCELPTKSSKYQQKQSSEERKSNIKLSILTAIKKKQGSTKIINDIERKYLR